jgi:hypothetical protein
MCHNWPQLNAETAIVQLNLKENKFQKISKFLLNFGDKTRSETRAQINISTSKMTLIKYGK